MYIPYLTWSLRVVLVVAMEVGAQVGSEQIVVLL
jgi:hypothetical protein